MMRLNSPGASCHRLKSAGSDVSEAATSAPETLAPSSGASPTTGTHSPATERAEKPGFDELISILTGDWDSNVEKNGFYVFSTGGNVNIKLKGDPAGGAHGSFVAIDSKYFQFAAGGYTSSLVKNSAKGNVGNFAKDRGSFSRILSFALPFEVGYGNLSPGFGGRSESVSLTIRMVNFGIRQTINSEGQLLYRGFSIGSAVGGGVSIERVNTTLHDVQWHSYNLEHHFMDMMRHQSSF